MITHAEVQEEDGRFELKDELIFHVPVFATIYKRYGIDMIKYIIFTNDNWSPYRHFKESEREEKIISDVFKNGKVPPKALADPDIQKATKLYNDMQYDPILDQYKVFTQKIKEINKVIKEKNITFDDAKLVQDLIKQQKDINVVLINLKEYIDKSERKLGLKQIIDIHDFHNLK